MEENKQIENINEEILVEDDEIIEENLEELIEENQALIEKVEEKIQIEKKAEEIKKNDKRLQECNRQQDLKDRYANLYNSQIAAQQLGKSSADIYFNQHILFHKDHKIAEKMLVELEEMDKKCHFAELYSENSFKRKLAYKKIDITLLEALAEKEEGRPDKMQEYLSLRKEIQDQFPVK